MKKEVQNQIKGFQALFNATGHPVFGTLLMYVKREQKLVTLDGLGLEEAKQDGLSL